MLSICLILKCNALTQHYLYGYVNEIDSFVEPKKWFFKIVFQNQAAKSCKKNWYFFVISLVYL